MYIVTINGRRKFEVATEEEVWNTIGSQPFGSRYMVDSTEGEDTEQFVPF